MRDQRDDGLTEAIRELESNFDTGGLAAMHVLVVLLAADMIEADQTSDDVIAVADEEVGRVLAMCTATDVARAVEYAGLFLHMMCRRLGNEDVLDAVTRLNDEVTRVFNES